jgi:hypothetical protein
LLSKYYINRIGLKILREDLYEKNVFREEDCEITPLRPIKETKEL